MRTVRSKIVCHNVGRVTFAFRDAACVTDAGSNFVCPAIGCTCSDGSMCAFDFATDGEFLASLPCKWAVAWVCLIRASDCGASGSPSFVSCCLRCILRA